MDCPRCDGRLDTYAVETTDQTAVVCDACGFAGVAASHRPEESDPESWDRAIRRFERTEGTEDWTVETGRTGVVSLPADDSGPSIDPEALEESVAVATALEETAGSSTNDTAELSADDTPEEPTANAGDRSADDAGESTPDGTSEDSTADADEQSTSDVVEDR
jgi:hypothetical protein